MPSKTLEFSNMSYEVPSSKQDGRGCHVSVVFGFLFVLLTGVIAVGVGVIVHFAGGSREVVCKCDYAAGAEEVLQQCFNLASVGNVEICQRCPATTTTSTTSTTSGLSNWNTTLLTTEQSTVTTTQMPVIDVRLPTSLYPEHYDIEIQTYMNTTNPADFTFKGRVKIRLRCNNATDRVTLHTLELKVVNESVKVSGDGTLDPITVLGYDLDDARQFMIIRLNKVLQINKTYELEMIYTARITNSLVGLYYSSYKRNEATVYLATTSFQPTDARRVFPCFDEPALKSTFNVTLVRPENMISLSNMELINSNETFIDGSITYVKDVFGKSPVMSAYLLVIAVCDFDYLEHITDKNVTFRTYAVPELVNTTRYSLDTGVKLLKYFEDFFNISYTLPKLGMIALPDFVSGAMEHWGLISYSDRYMLYKEGETSESGKENVASVVSHELAHMWFGNLVTMSWWDDLWLNEGFASFVECLGVDNVHPGWNIFASLIANDVHSAFASDGGVSSHPLYVPVYHPDEINDIFDTISYSKGAAVIRMMRHFLGYETFKKGMNLYLNSMAYGNAFHDDLWNILSKQAAMDNKSINVKEIMDTWILQMNYPVVTVSRLTNSPNQLLVQQERFLDDRNVSEVGKYESPFNYTWIIPLTFTSNETRKFNQTDQDVIWMWRNETSKVISLMASPNSWVLANLDQNGYYRVNYDTNNWKALTDQLKQDHTVIPVINRAQIINDAWNLAMANYLTLEVAFSTLDYLDEETDYQPWQAVRRELVYMDRMLSVNSVYRVFQRFLQCKLRKPYSHFGLNNTGNTHSEILASTAIAGQACKYGIEDCLLEASKQYKNWMDSNVNSIDTNIRQFVYCYAISMGGFDEWNFALKKYNETELATERSNLLVAMTCTRHPWILNHFMNLILTNDSVIRHHERLTVLSSVAATPTGRSLAWNFYRAHFNTLKALYSSSTLRWLSLVDLVTRSLNTPYELEEVKSFKVNQGNNALDIATALNQAIDSVTANIKWLETYQGEIERIILKKLAETPECGASTKLPQMFL